MAEKITGRINNEKKQPANQKNTQPHEKVDQSQTETNQKSGIVGRVHNELEQDKQSS